MLNVFLRDVFLRFIPPVVMMSVYAVICLIGYLNPRFYPGWFNELFINFLTFMGLIQGVYFFVMGVCIVPYFMGRAGNNPQKQNLTDQELVGYLRLFSNFGIILLIVTLGYFFYKQKPWSDFASLILCFGFFVELKFADLKEGSATRIVRDVLYSGVAAILALIYVRAAYSSDPIVSYQVGTTHYVRQLHIQDLELKHAAFVGFCYFGFRVLLYAWHIEKVKAYIKKVRG